VDAQYSRLVYLTANLVGTSDSRLVLPILRRCEGGELRQDEDVLDTWFSSGLWPFSTLGWPDDTPELERFYPTSVLVTGFDILFFWVARMIMLGLKFKGDIPFHNVYIHALVRDAQGQKMSKSRGNVIDPLEVMDEYGTDALRFTLAALAGQGRDIRLSEERIQGYRNFMNKIWNAFRYCELNFSLTSERVPPLQGAALDLADRWILSRLQGVIAATRQALEEYRFNDAASELYQFFWHEFCDWYLEITKLRITGAEHERVNALGVLLTVFETSLRLMHPFIPFLTEEVWQQLPHQGETVVKAPYPSVAWEWIDRDAEQEMIFVMEVISALRNIRSSFKIPNTTKLRPHIKASLEHARLIERYRSYIVSLANILEMVINQDMVRPALSATAILDHIEIYVPLEGLIDVEVERTRLTRELKKIQEDVVRLEAKLARRDFLEKAPEDIIEKEQAKHQGLRERVEKLAYALESIQ
jgi:valyl-tRNA synthetase